MDKDLKQCTCCGVGKPYHKDYFWQSVHYEDGFHPECRVCATKKFLEKENNYQASFLKENGHGPDEAVIGRKMSKGRKESLRALELEKEQKEADALEAVGLKVCSSCNEVMGVDNFYPVSKTNPKLRTVCKTCMGVKNEPKPEPVVEEEKPWVEKPRSFKFLNEQTQRARDTENNRKCKCCGEWKDNSKYREGNSLFSYCSGCRSQSKKVEIPTRKTVLESVWYSYKPTV